MNKNLVVFFTHRGETYFPDGYRVVEKGNAEKLAEMVSKIIPADTFEIKTEKIYPVSYKECCDEAKLEHQKGELPTLKTLPENLDKYENIILIYPNWWNTMPRAVFSFLDISDFDGKGIFPICTHEGSGLGKSMDDLALTIPNAILYDGLSVYGHEVESSEEDLREYLNEWLDTIN